MRADAGRENEWTIGYFFDSNFCTDLDAEFAEASLDEAEGGRLKTRQYLLAGGKEFGFDAEMGEEGGEFEGDVVVTEDGESCW